MTQAEFDAAWEAVAQITDVELRAVAARRLLLTRDRTLTFPRATRDVFASLADFCKTARWHQLSRKLRELERTAS